MLLVFKKLKDAWQYEMDSKSQGKRSISKALFRTVGFKMIWGIIALNAVSKAIAYIPVLILGQLVQYYSGTFLTVTSLTAKFHYFAFDS